MCVSGMCKPLSQIIVASSLNVTREGKGDIEGDGVFDMKICGVGAHLIPKQWRRLGNNNM